MSKLTIVDIARLAGVSKSTVSRVINQESHVKKETKDKILSIIEQYQFSPSSIAQKMRTQQSKTIGILGTRLDSPAEVRAFRGIIHQCEQEGFEPIFFETQALIEKTEEYVELLLQKQVDGMIIFAIPFQSYEWLKKIEIPIIMIAQSVPGFHSIIYDDYQAIQEVLQQWKRKNIQKIGYIGVKQQDYTTGYLRHKAYQDFCCQHQLENIEALGEFTPESGYALAQEIFLTRSVEALICATDMMALGVRKYLQEKNIECDVCGVGDVPLLSFLFSNHMTITHQYKRSGIYAVELISKLMGQSMPAQVYSLPGSVKQY